MAAMDMAAASNSLSLLPWLLAAVALAWMVRKAVALVWVPYRAVREFRRQGILTMKFRPFLGQLPEFKKLLQDAAEETEPCLNDSKLVSGFRLWEERYGTVVGMCFGPIPRLNISEPSLVREVLNGTIDDWPKTAQQKRNLSILGNGLVNSNGSLWLRQRRMMNPSFGHRSIKETIHVMAESTEKMMKRWAAKVDGANGVAEVDINRDISGLALEIIGLAAFGDNIGSGSDRASEISVTVAEYLEAIIQRILSGALFIPGYLFLPTELNKKISRCERKIRALTMELIQKRREAQAQGDVGKDLLASMLAATDDETNVGMTNQQLVDEALNILLAGHETTAQLVTWTMYLLALHPSWQQRLRAETFSVMGKQHEMEEDWGKLTALKDLHLVLHESLRLYPPVPIISRGCIKEVKLGPYRLPAGTMVAIPITHLHHRKDLWGEDADEFRPERFAGGLAEACKEPQMFLPFSGGQRNCIGQAFALTEAKVIMVHILRLFSWRLSPGYKLGVQAIITLRPNKGMPMLLERIDPAR